MFTSAPARMSTAPVPSSTAVFTFTLPFVERRFSAPVVDVMPVSSVAPDVTEIVPLPATDPDPRPSQRSPACAVTEIAASTLTMLWFRPIALPAKSVTAAARPRERIILAVDGGIHVDVVPRRHGQQRVGSWIGDRLIHVDVVRRRNGDRAGAAADRGVHIDRPGRGAQRERAGRCRDPGRQRLSRLTEIAPEPANSPSPAAAVIAPVCAVRLIAPFSLTMLSFSRTFWPAVKVTSLLGVPAAVRPTAAFTLMSVPAVMDSGDTAPGLVIAPLMSTCVAAEIPIAPPLPLTGPLTTVEPAREATVIGPPLNVPVVTFPSASTAMAPTPANRPADDATVVAPMVDESRMAPSRVVIAELT